MPTIASPKVILELLQNGGCYLDDPPCISIWKYITPEDQEVYAVFYDEVNDMFISPSVHFPELLMYRGKLTDEGRLFISENTN